MNLRMNIKWTWLQALIVCLAILVNGVITLPSFASSDMSMMDHSMMGSMAEMTTANQNHYTMEANSCSEAYIDMSKDECCQVNDCESTCATSIVQLAIMPSSLSLKLKIEVNHVDPTTFAFKLSKEIPTPPPTA
jgi:hypothetical protein